MRRPLAWLGVIAGTVLLLIAAVATRVWETTQPEPGSPNVDLGVTTVPVTPPSTTVASPEAHQGFLYGRITTVEGTTYEGRLRLGGNEEAFWSDYFNGYKDENPWADHVPPEQLTVHRPIEIFGVTIVDREEQIDLGRPFMVPFGNVVHIEPRGRRIHVTLKSGTMYDLDRLNADDLGDGVRVWDSAHGVVDFGELRIRSIELLPTAQISAAPTRLQGTVRTSQGDFTGFVQWDRWDAVGTDTLDGQTANGEISLRFDTIASIARGPSESLQVTLLDSRQVEVSGGSEVGEDNRGAFVDDPRYGRVLISWAAFERVDFSRGGTGPAFDDFRPGRRLTGSVATRDGRRLTGRLVYDLDESETIETLDAPSRGVNYTIPFGLVAAIVPQGPNHVEAEGTSVTLHSGEELQLERAGDLGEGNAGLLIFVDDSERPEYVPWSNVARVDFDRPLLP